MTRLPPPGGRVGGVPAVQRARRDPLLQPGDQLVALVADPHGLELGAGAVLLGEPDLLLFVDQHDLGQRVVAVDHAHHLRGGDLLVSTAQAATQVDQQTDRQHGQQDPDNGSTDDALEIHDLPEELGSR
jgi:hypothetical protein